MSSDTDSSTTHTPIILTEDEEEQYNCRHYVKLQSSDGRVFEVNLFILQQSWTLMQMLGHSEWEFTLRDTNPVPIPNIRGDILEKVLKWMKHHCQDDNEFGYWNELEADHLRPERDCMSKWDREFLKVDKETLFELVRAADYLNVQRLMNYICYTWATTVVNGKTVEEIRDYFNIENDLTEDDEELIRIQKEIKDWGDLVIGDLVGDLRDLVIS